MTNQQLIDLLANSFYEDFANTVAKLIVSSQSSEKLYQLINDQSPSLAKAVLNKVHFRGAYVLERLFFDYPTEFALVKDLFWDDFCLCYNPSARRHYAKMMAHLLEREHPSAEQMDAIGEAAAAWCVEPTTKVAVRVWCLDILANLRSERPWIDDIWEDILEVCRQGASPGMLCRIKKYK